jgi:hypothetical protein
MTTLTPEQRDIMRQMSSDNPRSRRHHEQREDGWSSWGCIPIRDAVEARAALLAAAEPGEDGLRETMLNIGADHEGHHLFVLRTQDSPDIGPGDWLLVCEDDEAGPLLDFADLDRAALRAPVADDEWLREKVDLGICPVCQNLFREVGHSFDCPLRAPVADAGLDVGVLTRVLAADERSHRPSAYRGHSWGWFRNHAERLAAEYARLAATEEA